MTKYNYKLVSLSILLIYVSVFFIFGDNSYILIHDNMDSSLSWYKALIQSGMIFSQSNEIISSFMSAHRVGFASELDVILWLNYFFEQYTAYAINQVLIRLVAFLGMFSLLNRYIFNEENIRYSYFIALLYSILPFWSPGGLSVAGLPMITYILLNIRGGINTKRDWMGLILFPLYSSFVLSMVFYIVFAGFVWIYDIYKRTVTTKFTIALFLFGIIYLIINYRLLEGFLFEADFTPHRVEFFSDGIGLIGALMKSAQLFILGQYHASSLHIIFLPFVGVVFLLNIFSKSRDRLLIGLFLLNICISLWYGFYGYEGIRSIINASGVKLASLSLTRFYFLSPFIWYILFALSVKWFFAKYGLKYKFHIVNTLIGLTVLLLFFKSDFINEYRKNGITYKQFYSERLFKEVASFIGKKQSEYKVVSIGIHPSISQHNGFHTLDGYLTLYPLEYKHKFRRIIKDELSKNEKLRYYYDNWGSRVYVFIAEIGTNYLRNKNEVYPITISLNTQVLKEMGGEYVFSSYFIVNAQKNNMELLKKFKNKDSAWDIYLYKLKQNN